jgi:hypothetical protein
MGAQFEASVREADIANARWIESDWLGAEVVGDVSFCANVVYYVSDIVPFLAKLHASSLRRAMIVLHSLPPVNAGARLSQYVYGIDPVLDPGQRELLPVLWDMGILPDVCVLGPSDFIANRQRFVDRDEAISSAIPGDLLEDLHDAAHAAVAAHFDEFFVALPDAGFRRSSGASRVVLITWETSP